MQFVRSVLALIILCSAMMVVPTSNAGANELFEYFPTTGHYVRGEFLNYFNAVGGIDTLGNPRTENYREGDRLVQYFQNGRLEYDCGKDGRQPCVPRPGTLGELILGKKLELSQDQENDGIRTATEWYFPQTNIVVAEPFFGVYSVLGTRFFGYPLTEPTVEGNETVQWFQRAKLVVDRDGVVKFAALGDFYIDTLRRVSPAYLLRRPAPAPSVPIPVRAKLPTGRLAFQTSFGGEIVTVNADGSEAQVVTVGGEPALSPDGTQLAFVRWTNPNGIFIRNLITGDEKLVADVVHPRAPTWSPDGTRLAFLKSKTDPVFKLDPVTRRPRYVDEEHFSVAVLDVGSGEITDIASRTFSQSPSFSPDGKRLVFDGNEGLFIVNIVDGPNEPLKIQPTNNQYTQPTWSPDGSLIAFSFRRHDHYDIAVIRPTGGGVQLVTQSPIYTNASNNVSPSWSPDGSQIAFLSDRDGTWQLYTVDLDGKNVRPVFAGDNPFRFNFSDERVVSWGS